MKAAHKETVSEGSLVVTLTAWLVAHGYRVKCEVANMGQSADIVATKGRWVTVFEAKVGNWRRALQQCQAHETVADYICVAIASTTIRQELEVSVSNKGYGLLHYRRHSREWTWIRRPTHNPHVWQPQRRVWANNARKIRYAH